MMKLLNIKKTNIITKLFSLADGTTFIYSDQSACRSTSAAWQLASQIGILK